MSWLIIVGLIAVAIVAFELLLSGPSVFVVDDPRTLNESLRVLVARGKHLASLRIATESPKAALCVQKFVERKMRISFAITTGAVKPSHGSETEPVSACGPCDVAYPCLDSEVDRIVSCLRLALDEAYKGGGGTLPIRGEGSLSGILAFNVSQATGITKAERSA